MLNELYQLQQLEIAAAALETERVNSDEYRQLLAIRTSFEAGKEKLNKLKAEIAKLESRMAAFVDRVAELEGRIEKEKQAMYDGSVTNPRELAAREGQLESLESKLETVQNDREERKNQLLNKQDEAAKLRASLTDMKEEFSRIRDLYQVKQEERDGRRQQLLAEKEVLVQQIDADSLAWFESVKDNFAGAPIARLDKAQICSGCHTMVPPTTYKRTALGQRTFCENCGRTLFVDD